ncbi:helix-turn-helix transcriptional regulator [Burkholderia cenocepacia]|uniref:helix-turn-helix transcriptional regulator n=1 Tax=Burkholderia cenocepacia TaxID=95486 RepID=UPI002446295A|nr:AlpA family phage regulatory protein [Burkholderia cenocepacia]
MRNAELSTTTERLLRLPSVISMVGLGKTTIYDMMKEGSFPRPRRVRNLSMGRNRSTSMDSFHHFAQYVHRPITWACLDLICQSASDQV